MVKDRWYTAEVLSLDASLSLDLKLTCHLVNLLLEDVAELFLVVLKVLVLSAALI